MSKKDEALKLALEYRPTMNEEVLHSWATEMKKAAQEALAEQPAQPQEPLFKPLIDLHPGLAEELKAMDAPAQQEPVTFLDWYDNAHWGNEDFKAGCWRAWEAALTQRTWVGLTFAEICECETDYLHIFARAIEAKLKEKNT